MNSSVYGRNAEMSWRAGWFLQLALAMLTLVLFDTRAALATQLHLLRLQCINPATSFGDDIQIFVNGAPAGKQFGIDKSDVHNLSEFTFQVGDETANLTVTEDNDHAADFEVSVSKEGQHAKEFAVKEGGVYRLYYEVIAASGPRGSSGNLPDSVEAQWTGTALVCPAPYRRIERVTVAAPSGSSTPGETKYLCYLN